MSLLYACDRTSARTNTLFTDVNNVFVDISKHLIAVAIEQRNWMLVSSQVQKLRSTQMAAEEVKALQPYITVTSGLAFLASGNYYEAALSFISTEGGVPANRLNHIVSLSDIAIYGGLCVLATMDRAELQARVLDNPDFRTYLELEPHIRRAIGYFINSRYSACLAILESYRADYLLDVYLQPHVSELYRLVRSKSIVQYFIPFSCVTLGSMNEAFASPGSTIDSELVSMIESGMLDARVDTQNRVCSLLPNNNQIILTLPGSYISSHTPTCKSSKRGPLYGKGIQPRSTSSYPAHESSSRRSRGPRWQPKGQPEHTRRHG